MKWFYMVRGNCARRGSGDEARLAELARTGQLGPDDLLWNEESGTGWVRASSLPGLFVRKKNGSEVLAKPAAGSGPSHDAGPAPVRPGMKRWVLVVGLTLLAVLIALLVIKVLKG